MSQEQTKKWAVAGIAVLVLFMTAVGLHNAGWSQGFAFGLLAGNADSAQIAPYMAYRAGHGGFFGFFGMLFRLGFFLFFLALIAKCFGFWRWRMHGANGPSWGHHERHKWHEHGPHREGEADGSSQAGPPSTPSGPEPQNTSWTHM